MEAEKYWKEKAKEAGMSPDELKTYCEQSLLIWSETHRIINGARFSLKDYPYLEEIYADMADEVICLKSAQAGLCLLPSTAIKTPTGWKSIDKLQPGDDVLTASWQTTKVKAVYSKFNTDRMVVIKSSRLLSGRIICTPEHKLFVKRGTKTVEMEARFIMGSDSLVMGTGYNTDDIPITRVLSYSYIGDVYTLEVESEEKSYIAQGCASKNSEYMVSTMLWFVDTNKGNTFFAFPKKSDCGIFVQSRVDKAIDETEYLSSQIRGKADNVSLKRFKSRAMYFMGSQKRTQIISSPADIILEDEYDEHNDDVHDTIEKRLNNSVWKWKRRISTPTTPDYGIHKKFIESDQRCWYSHCDACGREIKVSGDDIEGRWQSFIGKLPTTDEYAYWCPECHSFNFNARKGYWKASYPNRAIHGYSINRIMTATCEAKELMENYEKGLNNGTMSEFFRSDLGIPFQPAGSRIYEGDLLACISHDTYPSYTAPIHGRDYFVGVDTGNKKHVTIVEYYKERMRVVSAFILDKYEDIERVIDFWRPMMVVIDNRPEPTPVLALHKQFNEVRGAEHYSSLIKPWALVNKDDTIISYNKEFAIERVYNHIINKNLGIPSDINEQTQRQYFLHLTAFMRIEKTNEKGDRIRKFVYSAGGEKKQPDHYLFSLIYALAAVQCYQDILAQTPSYDAGILII